MAERTAAVGISAGLSWTPSGGDLMFVESMRMPGKGKVHLTGQMGDVMKESAAAAFTYLRARAASFGLDADFLTKIDVHVHLPQGGIPKDGPSAGIAILVSLASMLTGIKVRPDVAMTGEITLRGNVLRVGGVKDKFLAAHRAGIKHVILPKLNEPDLDEVPKEIRDAMQVHLVSHVDEALAIALERMPTRDRLTAPSRPCPPESRAPHQPMLLTLRTARWALGFSLLSGPRCCACVAAGERLGPRERARALAAALAVGLRAGARMACAHAGAACAPKRWWVEAILGGWLLVLVPVLILALNALRVKTCDPWRGLSFLALGPLAQREFRGACCGCTLGAWVKSAAPGHLVRRAAAHRRASRARSTTS